MPVTPLWNLQVQYNYLTSDGWVFRHRARYYFNLSHCSPCAPVLLFVTMNNNFALKTLAEIRHQIWLMCIDIMRYYRRAEWLRGRASDSRLREPGFDSCAAVLKHWASVFTRYCYTSLSCINEYLAIDSDGYVCEQPPRINCSICLDAKEVKCKNALSRPEDRILRYVRTYLFIRPVYYLRIIAQNVYQFKFPSSSADVDWTWYQYTVWRLSGRFVSSLQYFKWNR